MKKLLVYLAVAAALLTGSFAFAAVELNSDYKMLNPPQPASKALIEVRNFFFYGCSHCFRLHQQMAGWEKSLPTDVNLIYVPVIFNSSAEPMARTYFALESLGQARQLQDPIFKAWHVDNRDLSDVNKIADFVASQGVDRARFLTAYNSPSIQGKMDEANQMSQRYMIRGTPTLIVDGKYVISGLTPEKTVSVLTEVIDVVRKGPPLAVKAVTPATTAVAAQETAPPSREAVAPTQEPKPGQEAVASTQEPKPIVKRAKSRKTPKAKPMRPKNLDLRHCLELDTNAAIAKCAGE